MFLCTAISLITGISLLNYIVDPYSITKNNILNIPVKLVSDDRSEKIVRIENEDVYDNIMLGSSRVYLMNSLVLSKMIGGKTYNLGVGTAQIEDHLGFLLYLEKINKFPKTIIVGLDFYSFNDNLETNKYFTRNEKLNFINAANIGSDYLSDFVSLDTAQASLKTLKTFIGMNSRKSRFDEHGAAGESSKAFGYYPVDTDVVDIYSIAKERRTSDFIRTPPYNHVSTRRLDHLRQIVEICGSHKSTLKVFVTPLYSRLLKDIYDDVQLNARLTEFKSELSKITDYYDFLTINDVTSSSIYFDDPSHMKTTTGNLILARIFEDKDIDIPVGFGDFRKKITPPN